MVRKTPESSPHFSTPIGIDKRHPIAKPSKGRRSLMTGVGLFDLPQVSAPNVIEPITLGQTELGPRKLKFKRGTKLYKVVRDSEGRPIIPRTPVQEDDLFDRRLTVATYLDVPVEYLEIGKRGGTITRKVGQSDYGAFTIVRFPVRSSSGKVVMEERLVSYTTRSSKKQI